MKLKRGTTARFTLMDGTTIEGTVSSRLSWWTYRLVDVSVHGARGTVEAAGYFLVPRRVVTFIQVDH